MSNSTGKYCKSSLSLGLICVAITFVKPLNYGEKNIAIAQTNRQSKPTNNKPKKNNREPKLTNNKPKSSNPIQRWITSIWRRSPKKTLGARSGICPIAPGLVETRKIWHNRPLFLWHSILKNEKARLIVRERHSQESLWIQKVNIAEQKVFYNGQSLESDKLYQWKLEGSHFSTSWTTFQILTANKRSQIKLDLQALKQELQAKTSQEIALKKAEYFFNYSAIPQSMNHLWSDGLQVLYQVEKPSQSFVNKREKLVSNICTLTKE